MTETPNKHITLIVSATVAFVGAFIMTAINVALPSISNEFGTDAIMLGWISNVTILISAATLLPFGRMADIYGRKKIFVIGVMIMAVSSFLCGTAQSSISLVIFRGLLGLASGMTVGTSVAILTSVFPLQERGRALGINVAAVYAGLSLAPALGGIFTQQLSWRYIFFFGSLLALFAMVLCFWKLKGEWAEARGEHFDRVGSIIFTVSLPTLIYGFTELPSIPGIILGLAGLAGLVVFVWWEARTESPILNVSIFRKNTVFIFSNIATLVNYSATFAVTYLMSLYLQYIQGFSAQDAGLILIVQPAVMAITAIFAGRLSDRFPAQKVAALGMSLACTALLIFAFLSASTSLITIIFTLVIFGLGAGFFSSPNTNAVMSSVGISYLGVASGTQATMRSGGMTLSIGIVMILFSIYMGNVQITPEYYPAFLTSTRVGFVIFAALCFGGIFAQLTGRNNPRMVS
jgi:MFS family permease